MLRLPQGLAARLREGSPVPLLVSLSPPHTHNGPELSATVPGRTFESLQQVLSHVPAGSFKVGKLSQAAQFQPSFHFICSGSHSKELFNALSPEQATLHNDGPMPH